MNQLSLDFARARGDLGSERAALRAEKRVPGWIDAAAEAVRGYAVGVGPLSFTIEEARIAVQKNIPEPPDLRAWGHVTRRAVSLGVIERTGDYAPAVSSNGSIKPLYRKGKAA